MYIPYTEYNCDQNIMVVSDSKYAIYFVEFIENARLFAFIFDFFYFEDNI